MVQRHTKAQTYWLGGMVVPEPVIYVPGNSRHLHSFDMVFSCTMHMCLQQRSQLATSAAFFADP